MCKLPPEQGPCRGRIPRFYYSASSKRCELFTYGGCQGNANNFKTEEDCVAACGDRGEGAPGLGAVAGTGRGAPTTGVWRQVLLSSWPGTTLKARGRAPGCRIGPWPSTSAGGHGLGAVHVAPGRLPAPQAAGGCKFPRSARSGLQAAV